MPAPSSPSDFRPITIFGLLYRCWSSFHARQALLHLDDALPASLHGSRPGRHAKQIWSQMLWAIEEAFIQDIPMTGAVADLSKAFNFLPRLAVMEIAAHMGIPGFVLVAWTGALTDMRRRFQLRESVTKGVASVTGMPEGCGLSCVAMVLIDACFHKWMQVFFPLCAPLSFVDDWQLLTCHPSLLQGAVDCMHRFAQVCDLQMDAKKAYVWSLCPEGRKLLKHAGHRVVLGEKNLGAHMQFSRKHTNAALQERVNSMAEVWPKLRASACHYKTKLRALTVAAWPKALHAIEATALGNAAYHKLRTGALKGLDVDAAGVNAWLHMGLVENPGCDPQCWSILQTIRSVRDCGQRAQIKSMLSALVSGGEIPPHNSFTSTLLTRLQFLGWQVLPTGCVADQFGTFCLFDACFSEIRFRVSRSWQQVVAQQVQHRPGLRDLHQADDEDTRCWLSHLAFSDQELFKRCLNGCHITQDAKAYCQEEGTDQCPFCLSSDSRFHRFWVCEHFAAARAEVPQSHMALIADAPEFLTCYGWSVRPHTLTQWLQCLDQIPDPPEIAVADCHGTLHLFTDGSCLNQQEPKCRVATWAVVRAAKEGFSQAQVLASGPLPGVLQSAYRAEVFAIWRALVLARAHDVAVCLWTDCAAVVKRLRRCCSGRAPKPNSAHADLWLQIFECLQDLSPDRVTITKVAAHQPLHTVQSPLEEWCAFHNHMADNAALWAQWQRPNEFWSFYHKHVQAVQASRDFSRTVQRVLLAISQLVVRSESDVDPELREEVGQTLPVPAHLAKPLLPYHVPWAATRWYGEGVVRSIMSWFWLSMHGADFPLVWVSQYHLYVDFMLCGGIGPIKFPDWQAGELTPEVDLINISFQKRTRWFCKVLKECLKHSGVGYSYFFGRPKSRALHLHTGCLALAWDPKRIEAADNWFLHHIPTGVFRTTRALDSLPHAKPDDSLPAIWVSCA